MFAGPVGRVDLLAEAFFLFYAIIFFLDCWQGSIPFVFLGGDAGDIASYAAALNHRGLFADDRALVPGCRWQRVTGVVLPSLIRRRLTVQQRSTRARGLWSCSAAELDWAQSCNPSARRALLATPYQRSPVGQMADLGSLYAPQ